MKINKEWIKTLKRYKETNRDLLPPKPNVRSILDVFGIPLSTSKLSLFLRLKKRKLLK